jgi:hypothetical protein
MGVEALVRWENPERGLLSPGAFIPVAEESDLIVLLGDWMLEQTCRLLVRPELVGQRLLLSVNVSARQFRRPIRGQAAGAAGVHGGRSSRLTLEVTEGLVLGDFDEAAHRMLQLREMGIQFALDDFGTGYSSMAYLKRRRSGTQDRPELCAGHEQEPADRSAGGGHFVGGPRFGLRWWRRGGDPGPGRAAACLGRRSCARAFCDQPIPWQAWARYVQQLQPPVTDTGTEA